VIEDTNPPNARSVKIGELLIGVGVLTTGDLTEAIQISKRMGVPIGRVLVMSGCVNETNLQHALELQSLIKDGLVEKETGFKALQIVFRQNKDLQSALKDLNWAPRQDASGNKLGELLIDSNIVSRSQLAKALETSFQSGMPLGGTLVLQGVLSAQLLPTILHTQEQIRDNKLTRDEAIQTLQTALLFWARADQSKQEDLLSGGSAKKTNNMVEISSSSAHAKQPSHIAEMSTGHATPMPVPSSGGIRQTLPTVQAQAKVGTNAGAGIGTFASIGIPGSPPPGSAYSTVPAVSLIDLMKLSAFCTQSGLDQAVQNALDDSRLAAKLLLAIGMVDGPTLNIFVSCQSMIAKGELKTEQALYVLNSIRHRKVTLEQALAELGIQTIL
jgi:hypothetical protein